MNQEKIQEIRGLVLSMDRKIRKMRNAGICPAVSDIQHMSKLQSAVEELALELEAERDAKQNWLECQQDACGKAWNEIMGHDEPITWEDI